jgi:tRNA(adenine34) deaminase
MPTEARSDTELPDIELLRVALDQAREAERAGDHPYGAVIVTGAGTVIERNRVESTPDPTAHSEVMAVRTAARQWGLPALAGAALVTSFEPCPMCLGAILEAGVRRLVIGGRRTVGEKPLGDYQAEALLAMLGRTGDLAVETLELPEITEFYACRLKIVGQNGRISPLSTHDHEPPGYRTGAARAWPEVNLFRWVTASHQAGLSRRQTEGAAKRTWRRGRWRVLRGFRGTH